MILSVSSPRGRVTVEPLGHTSLAGTINYYVSGPALAYYCVYPSGGGTCSTSDVSSAVTHITNSCGSYVPGWYTLWFQPRLWVRSHDPPFLLRVNNIEL